MKLNDGIELHIKLKKKNKDTLLCLKKKTIVIFFTILRHLFIYL